VQGHADGWGLDPAVAVIRDFDPERVPSLDLSCRLAEAIEEPDLLQFYRGRVSVLAATVPRLHVAPLFPYLFEIGGDDLRRSAQPKKPAVFDPGRPSCHFLHPS